MADLLNIYKICPKCKGKGKIEEGVIRDNGEVLESIKSTCPVCNGDKELLWGQMREEES